MLDQIVIAIPLGSYENPDTKTLWNAEARAYIQALVINLIA